MKNIPRSQDLLLGKKETAREVMASSSVQQTQGISSQLGVDLDGTLLRFGTSGTNVQLVLMGSCPQQEQQGWGTGRSRGIHHALQHAFRRCPSIFLADSI